MNRNGSLATSFDDFYKTGAELKQAAQIAVNQALKTQPGEKAIIITNPVQDVAEIAFAMYDAFQEAGAHPVIIFQSVKTQVDFAEEAVMSAFESIPDIVVSLSAEKLGKDRDGMETPYEWDGVSYDNIFHYQMYGAKTVRSFWSPSVTRKMFEKTVPIDYKELREQSSRLGAILDKAVSVQVTNANGTNVSIDVTGRHAKPDDGDFSRPGSGGNLPAGETFISPVVGKTNGTIVYDGSISSHKGIIVIKTPIRCTVKDGFVTDITGGEEAEQLKAALEAGAENARKMAEDGKLPKEKLEEYVRNARNIGELGIGLNPKADIIGNMLQDEKAFKTCHFAIGSNYDGDAPAIIHLDGIVSNPTIIATMADGKTVTLEKDGELV